MSPRFATVLLAGGLLLAPLSAGTIKRTSAPAPAPAPAAVPAPITAPAPVAANLGPDDTIYYVCLLTKGAKSGQGSPEERRRTQLAENAYINQLAKEGKLLIAGPFADNYEWKGIYIFKCATQEEANALAVLDPAVLAGRLKFEIHPWITEKGSIRDPEFRAVK